jgi:uncharacterized protein (DUF2164 family)
MAVVELEKVAREALLGDLRTFMDEELKTPLGQFDGEFLLDFLLERLGSAVYNQALLDAQTVLSARFESLSEDLTALEKLEPR